MRYCDACFIVVNFISAIAVARHSEYQHLDKEQILHAILQL
jgi:hypothetical protein